jgi:hypothetical protein
VYEGQWYIQDGNGGARTLVNGQPTPEPTPVHSGDVITLGLDPSPPTLVIDPFGLMGHMEPVVEVERPMETQVHPAPAARYPTLAAGPRGVSPRPTMPAGMPDVPPQIGGIYAAFQSPEEPQAAEAEDDWMSAAAAAGNEQGAKRYYVPKQNTWSPGMISAAVFISLGIIVGAGYLYHVRQNAENERGRQAQAQVKTQEEAVKKTNIFDDMEREAKKKKALAEIAANANKPKVATVDGTAAQDPGRQTEEWRKVEEAHSSFKPIEAILVFNDYSKQFPTSPYAGDVRKFTEDALDAIWWERIVDIAQEREEAKKEIVARNRDMAQTQDPEFKKQLAEEKAAFEEKLQLANDKLKAKNYLSDTKPNIYDPDLMAVLRRARNSQVYGDWKAQAEKRIKETRGQKALWD